MAENEGLNPAPEKKFKVGDEVWMYFRGEPSLAKITEVFSDTTAKNVFSYAVSVKGVDFPHVVSETALFADKAKLCDAVIAIIQKRLDEVKKEVREREKEIKRWLKFKEQK